MNALRFELNKIAALLRHSENDPDVRNFFGRHMSNIERHEYYGFLEFKPDGVAVVFNEAPWVKPPKEITDPRELYLIAFHLYREGHEGFAGYSGQFPNGVAFGDTEAELLRKMGQPLGHGGGNMFPVLNRRVPYWLRYSFGDATLRFQFDQNGRMEMATLSTPTVNPDTASESQ